MYGFLQRLSLWLSRAAAGELDPDDAPLHPPVIYGQTGSRLFVVGADAPAPEGEAAWVGFAKTESREHRVDIVGWEELPTSAQSALAILLPRPFSWEYPERIDELFDALERQGIVIEGLWKMLALCSRATPKGQPLHVVMGTPMRRGHDGRPRYHIAVWEIAAEMSDRLQNILPQADDNNELTQARKELSDAVLEWAKLTRLSWCWVAENRPEIVIRRDDRSPLLFFKDKIISIWGCGAIGAHVAEWLTRAGSRKLILYDNDIVTPGILVRQPFTDGDVGRGKVWALRDRLLAIRPDLEIDANAENVLNGPLARNDWHDGADIVIDATASSLVRLKLELLRRLPLVESRTIVGMLFGHTAERAIATIARPEYSGGPEDILRRAKLDSLAASQLRAFADEFWPSEPRTEHFQPEPGCSDITFRGSGAEVAALSAELLHAVSIELAAHAAPATAHLFALPAAEHEGVRSARLSWNAATTLEDGIGDYELRLAPEALAEIRGWIAHNNRALDPASETGGILYGRRDETSRIVWVDRASGPPPDSVATPGEFLCGTEGVEDMTIARATGSRGELSYLGIWHTHPQMSPRPSLRDLAGMFGLVASQPLREAVMLIVGGTVGEEQLAGYVFNGDELHGGGEIEVLIEPHPKNALPCSSQVTRDIGLALSGGGSRAVAFHLGCLRALHDRGILDRVRVVSGVSGGALMTGLWAYGSTHFEEFDDIVCGLLRTGLQRRILRRALLSRRTPQALASSMLATGASASARVMRRLGRVALPRSWSRTDAFADVLTDIFDGALMHDSRVMDGLDVVINACDLRTGHAFRFGSRESGSWALGRIPDNHVDLATSVAASAAYPLLLPALERSWPLEKRDGSIALERVALADGGVFDNLGTSCLRPGRSDQHSYNVFGVDYVISCDAGRGQLEPRAPGHLLSRVSRSFEASFRKLQDAGRAALHTHDAHGELKGFVMPYLGQQDTNLPWQPPDLVRREQVVKYPTDFAAMNAVTIALLARRGEQLTRLLIEAYCPDL
jgi:predicted acylesterase/phospholipase RssA/proteasome lid subunit RPN8/RPN11